MAKFRQLIKPKKYYYYYYYYYKISQYITTCKDEDCQARKLNKEDAMDRCKWRKMIKEAR